MHEELIRELLSFASRNDLRFEYNFNEEIGVYFFKFQNQERWWGYRREISKEQLDSFSSSTVLIANDIIESLKKKDTGFVLKGGN